MRWIGQITYDEVAYFREDVIIEAGNKLGIGTTSPAAALHVKGGDVRIDSNSSNGQNLQFRNNGTANALLSNSYNINAGSSTDFNAYVYGNNPYSIWTNSANRLSVTGAGNVGIGTTSPDDILHILKDQGGVASALKLENKAGANNSGFDIDFQLASSGLSAKIGAIRTNNPGAGDTDMFFSTSTNGSTATEAMRITHDGNVGIGTTSPSQLLELKAANPRLRLINSDNNERVEIGDSAGNGGFLDLTNDADTKNIILRSYGVSYFNGGNVGIGTASPASKLHVEGAVQIGVNDAGHDFTLYGDTANYNMMWDASSSRLEANDNVKFNFGTGNDLSIYHTGSHSNIEASGTGDLKITQATDDQDIILQCDDGSGGTTAYLTLDGSAGTVTLSKSLYFNGGYVIDSAHSLRLDSTSGQAVLISEADTTVASFRASATGITTTKLTLTGALDVGIDDTGHDVKFFGATSGKYLHWDESADKLYLADGTELRLGTGGDVAIFHDGSNTYLENKTGSLIIRQQVDDDDIIFKCDDGSGGETAYLTLDGSATRIYVEQNMQFSDNSQLRLGTGSDFNLYHTGTGSVIQNSVGNLTIQQDQNDGDIIFRSDDGSGGTTEYFRLDGSSENVLFSKLIKLSDNVELRIGDGNDLKMFSDGTDGYISGETGDLYIRQRGDNKDIIFQSDNGSGGLATYFSLDGSLADGTYNYTKWPDYSIACFGSSNDLCIWHDSNNSYIRQVGTGDLIIENITDDKDIILKSDNGSGGTTAYLTLDGSASTIEVAKTTRLADSVSLKLGSATDLELFHDGTNSFINNNTGPMFIRQNVDDGDIRLQSDDGSGGVTDYLTLDGSEARTNVSKDLRADDNINLSCGTSGDLNFRHDGTDSHIDNWTNDLTITNYSDDKDIIFKSDDGSGGVETYFFLDGSTGVTTFPDDKRLTFGTDRDLFLYHTGSQMVMKNYVGDMTFTNNANDKDIIFQSDDGSGGVTAYLTLDGSSGYTKAHKHILYEDNVKAMFGTGGDMQILHDGSNSYISQNVTGALYIENNATDGDVILRSDDGSGGTETYITIDGGLGYTVASKRIRLNDSVNLGLGSSNDLDLYHNATNSIIENWTGDLYIRNNANDKDVIFQSDDGSGGVTTYFLLDGSQAQTRFEKNAQWGDNVIGKFGSAGDLQLSHDATNSHIANYVGDLKITQNADDKDIIFNCDDGSGGNTAYLTLDGSAGNMKAATNMRFSDSKQLQLGDSGDLTLQHDGSASYISNAVGNVFITQNANDGDIFFKSDDGAGGTAIYFSLDGSAATHNGSATTGLYTNWPDNSYISLGTSSDLQLVHTGVNSVIQNLVGKLQITSHTDDIEIIQYANDKDIIFQSDDGSGGVETYFFLDGSFSAGNPCTVFPDNSNLQFGTGGDLSITHNGSDSYINNATGNLTISVNGTDKDLILKSDDGSGGETAYLTLDGGIGYTTAQKHILFEDNVKARFGSGSDLQVYHNGSNSYIEATGTGDLYIQQTTDDKDIIFQSDDGSGGVETYFFLDGSANGTSPLTVFPDNSRLTFGTGLDLNISHEAGNSYIQNITGDLYIKQRTDDGDMIFQCDDGSGGDATYLTLDGSAGTIEVAKPMNFADNVTLTSSGEGQPFLTLKTTHTTRSASAELQFLKDAADTEDGEALGVITFYGEDEGNNNTKFGHIKGSIQESTDGQEGGAIKLAVASHDGELKNGLIINDGSSEDEIDVTIGSTTTSLTTVAGNLLVNGADINFADVPTSDPGVAGRVWNDSGRLMISAG